VFEIATQNKKLKARFIIWLVLLVLCVAGLIKILFSGFVVNTNILDLLPKAAQTPAVATASDKFTNTMGKQLVFLIGNSNKQQAERAAALFNQRLLASQLLDNITYKISTSAQAAWATFYYPYRLSLLNTSDAALLQKHDFSALTQQALMHLYNPVGIANSSLLENDPWFFFQNYLTNLPKPSSQLTVSDQQLMTQYNGVWYVMVTASTKENSFSMSAQTAITQLLAATKAAVQQQIPQSTLLMTGMLFYAEYGSTTAQQDISTIGVGSLIGIFLLVMLSFRSLKPLVYILFSVAIGFLAAFVVTELVFSQIYLFTIVFGASLIGICVDYAFFYYADKINGDASWSAQQGLRNIFPGITLGLINVVLAYIIIAFTPFPGLKQLAVFSVTGLFMAYFTVVCVFPYLLKPQQKKLLTPLQRLSNFYLAFWQKMSTKKIISIFVMLAIVSILGICLLTSNDDIRILENPPVQLQQQEKQLKKIIGSDIGPSFYVVTGSTPEKALEAEQKLVNVLQQKYSAINPAYIALSTYLPTLAVQQQNFQLSKLAAQKNNLLPYLQKIGINKTAAEKIQQRLSALAFKPLTINDWVASPVSNSLRYLWLGKVEQQYASIVLLSNQLPHNELAKIAQELPQVYYLNKADEVSSVFKNYRQKISVLLLCAYIVLFIILSLRYGVKKALVYVLPPIAAACVSLAVLGLLGVPLTLFNLLALILVLGIAIDYILFFAETRSDYRSTMLAVGLSAITMALSFGLLALSETPVIHDFGLTILVGIVTAYLLSPIVILVSPMKHRGRS
jgi:predicted exporter